MRTFLRLALTGALLVPVVACGARGVVDTSALDDDSITVGSFNFPESVLLGELYAQSLERAGFAVERELNVGPRELVLPALQRGLLEVVPEYAGSALTFAGGTPSADASATYRELVSAMADRGITALSPSPAADRNGFAVTAATARRYGLRTLSDLSSVASAMAFGGPAECRERSLCLRGLESIYGLQFRRFVALDAGGPLTVAALRTGTVDVGLLFTSDPSFDTEDLVLLRDDLGLEPAENITPVARDEVLDRFGPGVSDAIDAVSSRLSTADLRRMNAQVAGGTSFAEVARAWLTGEESGE